MANNRFEIMENAARLLQDAKLLSEHDRFASAFALAVLGLEECHSACNIDPLSRGIGVQN